MVSTDKGRRRASQGEDDAAAVADDSRLEKAEERVRVLEAYIKEMSMKNMLRSTAAPAAKQGGECGQQCKEKRQAQLQEKEAEFSAELSKKDCEIAILKGVIVTQTEQIVQTKRQLEDKVKEFAALQEQFETGCKRLAHHASRYLEGSGFAEMSASIFSQASTAATMSMSHIEEMSANTLRDGAKVKRSNSHQSNLSGQSGETELEPAGLASEPQESPRSDAVDTLEPLRAADTQAYRSFPNKAALGRDPAEFLRNLRTDLLRLPKPQSVELDGRRMPSFENLCTLMGVEPTPEFSRETEQMWQTVYERFTRIEREMRDLFNGLQMMTDLQRADPVRMIQTTSHSLTRMMHDISQLCGPIEDIVRDARKASSEMGPMTRRLKVASSDFKVKEQRLGLKVELLERRLARLTSTLTSAQQDAWTTRRNSSHPDIASMGAPDAGAILESRDRDIRAAGRQVMERTQRVESLESQVIDLALAKYDAECTVSQLRTEQEYLKSRAKAAEETARASVSTVSLQGLDSFASLEMDPVTAALLQSAQQSSPAGFLEGVFPCASSSFPPMDNDLMKEAYAAVSSAPAFAEGAALPPAPAFMSQFQNYM